MKPRFYSRYIGGLEITDSILSVSHVEIFRHGLAMGHDWTFKEVQYETVSGYLGANYLFVVTFDPKGNRTNVEIEEDLTLGIDLISKRLQNQAIECIETAYKADRLPY